MTENYRETIERPSVFKRLMPASLFGRALLILVVPTLLIQLLALYFFYERHWASVVRNMSSALAGDVALLVHKVHHADEQSRAEWAVLSRHLMGMNIEFSTTPLAKGKHAVDTRFQEFYTQLRQRVGLPFYVVQQPETRSIFIHIQLTDVVLRIEVTKKRLISSTTTVFALWSIGSALLLLVVAVSFLRNQIRPITGLAHAAERFGMGDDDPEFRPRGAREVRQAGRAFLTMRERIRRQISARTAMLSGISHDLRTPLTRMKLQLAMLPENEDTEAMHEDVEEMEHMIEEYLDYARGAEGEDSQLIEVVGFLDDLVVAHERGDKPITLGDELPDADLTVPLKPRTFRRALDNIVVNALRYGGACHVSAAKGRNFLRIFIDDNGPGIAAEDREDVFRAFKRLDDSRNSNTGGVGLGLSIARDVVQAHGGDIHLNNRVDEAGDVEGLRVTVRLPLGRIR